jgi:hypothetical protein
MNAARADIGSSISLDARCEGVGVELVAESFLHDIPAVTRAGIGFEIFQSIAQDFLVPVGNRNRLISCFLDGPLDDGRDLFLGHLAATQGSLVRVLFKPATSHVTLDRLGRQFIDGLALRAGDFCVPLQQLGVLDGHILRGHACLIVPGRWALGSGLWAALVAATMTVMKDTLRAVFENGVFRPLRQPKGLSEHREVTLTVTAEDAPSSLADFGGRLSADDATDMQEIVAREFERVDAGEWK